MQHFPINNLSQSAASVGRLVEEITPFDALEAAHRLAALTWIKSGVPIFRIQKPNIPNQHLVSYFVVVDKAARKVLLVDHKKASLWLPTGGHVEIDENPHQAVVRECSEELNIEADFWRDTPLFITVTQTNDLMASHTDVSLWYVLQGNSETTYTYDQDEFNAVEWFDFERLPLNRTDPHMARFIAKLKLALT